MDQIRSMSAEQVEAKRCELVRWDRKDEIHAFSTAEEAKAWMVKRAIENLRDAELLVQAAHMRIAKCRRYQMKETK
jgi:hypothetical protein